MNVKYGTARKIEKLLSSLPGKFVLVIAWFRGRYNFPSPLDEENLAP